jgi:hypothetical protein
MAEKPRTLILSDESVTWLKTRGSARGTSMSAEIEAIVQEAMAREAGQTITRFRVRRQFVDGPTVCSIIDWEMAIPGLGAMTSAELLEVSDGKLIRGELIYDAEPLRRAMAQRHAPETARNG